MLSGVTFCSGFALWQGSHIYLVLEIKAVQRTRCEMNSLQVISLRYMFLRLPDSNLIVDCLMHGNAVAFCVANIMICTNVVKIADSAYVFSNPGI